MPLINPDLLDWWFKHKYNILFVGKHGVGKTSLIKSCFEKNNLILNKTYLYFSASTLDPWVDLIGIPKEAQDENGKVYLDLIRPKNLYEAEVEAIFFDEYNRSPKKVRNAIMELIQFKSINGFKFPKLKVIWAAINPDDEEIYDVEPIDPAQKDRFHVTKILPYDCDDSFFLETYGEDLALPAIEWWRELPEDQKNLVSPRRLQYVLDTYRLGGDISDIIPESSNIKKLLSALKCGSIEKKLKYLFEKNDTAETKLFFSNDNNVNSSLKYITKNFDYMNQFVHLFPKEIITQLLSTNEDILKFVVNKSNIEKFDSFKSVTRSILSSKSNTVLRNIIIREFAQNDNGKVKFFETSLKRSRSGFSEILSSIHSTIIYDSEDKIRKFDYLRKNIISDLTYDEALSVLIFCSRILCKNNSSINASDILWYTDIISIINFLLLVVENNKSPFSKTSNIQPFDVLDHLSNTNEEIKTMIVALQNSKYWEEIYKGTT